MANEYEILTFPGYASVIDAHFPPANANGKRIITFASHSGENLPSSAILGLHTALCKILHATGMGEYIERVLWDRDDIGCLASDGSTDISRLLFVL